MHRLNKGKPPFPTLIKGRCSICGVGTTVPFADVSGAGRGRWSPDGVREEEGGLVSFFFSSLAGGCCPASGLGRLPAGGRGQGLTPPLAPYDPLPRVGVTIPDGQPGYASCTLASSLPRGSGRSASRCPAPTRDERPSGVGASAPAGRRSPPRPAALTSASGTVVPASQAVRHPLLWDGENGFPLLSRCTVPERRWTFGGTVRVVGSGLIKGKK